MRSSNAQGTRDRLIYRATHICHYKLQEVGDHLGLHFSTISMVAKREHEKS